MDGAADMRCDVDGLDDIIADLKSFGDESENMAEEMLSVAGEAMEDVWQEEIVRRGFVQTGQMKRSVESKKNKRYRWVETYPMGEAEYKSKHSTWTTSNAEKAYILHHGKAGHLRATYFVNDIQEKGGMKAHTAMQQVLDKKLKEKGL